jgi:hypothetical protein
MRFGHLGFSAIQLAAGQQHGLDAACDGAVRVVHGFALGVVLAVDGHPFLGHHAGGQPQPETEEVRDHRVQFQRPVRLRAVQEDGDRRDGDVRGDQRKTRTCQPDAPSRPCASHCTSASCTSHS